MATAFKLRAIHAQCTHLFSIIVEIDAIHLIHPSPHLLAPFLGLLSLVFVAFPHISSQEESTLLIQCLDSDFPGCIHRICRHSLLSCFWVPVLEGKSLALPLSTAIRHHIAGNCILYQSRSLKHRTSKSCHREVPYFSQERKMLRVSSALCRAGARSWRADLSIPLDFLARGLSDGKWTPPADSGKY